MGFAETSFSTREREDSEENVIFPLTAHLQFTPIKEGTVVAVDSKLPFRKQNLKTVYATVLDSSS